VTEAGIGHRIASAYSQARETHISLFPGALDTLSWCREHGYRTALLTNGRGTAQRSKIARFGLAPHFELILIEGEFGFGKPDPRIYECALTTLQLASAETWMIGDNFEWDVAQPQRLGVTGVWVNPLGSQVPDAAGLEPRFVVGSIAELPGLLQRAR
jgi:putative hydrolase of the HAD superfamily